jgi:CheY-like chemotaxis protein
MTSQTLIARSYSVPAPNDVLVPTVLVIDDDPIFISHSKTMLEELGYSHQCAGTAREALTLIGHDPLIQIVVIDMEMSSMNAFVLIDEARARVGENNPLAVIMVSENPTAELAIKGLHVEAIDLLSKPLSFEAYSGALRRAMRHLTVRRAKIEGAAFNAELARLVSVIGRKVDHDAQVELTEAQLAATLRSIITSRSMRSRFFQGRLFADPAWDILLDLTRAEFEGEQVSVSSVCIAASVPMSTALRWVRQMTAAGLLRRWTDPTDCRRALIALTDATAKHMRDYLTAVHALNRKV